MTMADLTLHDIAEKLKASKLKQLDLTLEEFLQFVKLIPPEDLATLSFRHPVWHEIPILITDLEDDHGKETKEG